MLTIIHGTDSEPLDEEAVGILNRVYHLKQSDVFWHHMVINAMLCFDMISHIRRNRNKEPDFAEGENEPTDVCSPPTRAGS